MKLPFQQKLYLYFRLVCLYLFFYSHVVLAASPHSTDLQLTKAEQVWLAAHSTVKVAISNDYAPISFVNEDGQHIGISADYLARIELQIKQYNPSFKFDIVVPTAAQKAANDPLNKSVDVVVDFVDTPKRHKYWQYTKPYLTLPLHLIVRQNSKININLNKKDHLKIAVVGYYAAHELIESDYPNVDLILVESNQEGLKRVAFGEVDAYVSDLPVASYWASKAGLVSLKNAGKLPYTYYISFASSRQTPLLHSILEKSLATISDSERERINTRWIIGPFAPKQLVRSSLEWLLLISAPFLAIAAAWSIWRTIRQNRRLAKHQKALTLLTKNQLRETQKIEDVYNEIAQIAADTLQAERASVWLFDDAKIQLACKSLYLKSSQTFTSISPLLASDLPVYFQALESDRVIAVNDAINDPITSEFTHGYLQNNNIGALLDGTIHLNGQTIGVICLEHTNGERAWTLDEQSFVGSLADLCRISLETCRRRDAEDELIKLNSHLEQLVSDRTKSLAESEKRFSYIVQHAPIPILILEQDGTIVDANPEAITASGYLRQQLKGKNFTATLVNKASRVRAIKTAAMLAKGAPFRNVELKLQHADGTVVDYYCSIGSDDQTRKNDNGQMVAIAQNISQHKALESSLIKAREAAESADRIKSMFVASMSHELRTPLNSIIGFLGVVLHGMSGELNLKQKDQLGRAYHSSKHLLSLITDVIDISKIEAGFLQVHVEKFKLSALFNEVQHAVQHLAEEKDLDLAVVYPKDTYLETDRKRLYQVILNVVSNGLKYTEQGAVKVTVTIKNKMLIIVVEDTGIGINEAGLNKLFKPFERIDSHLKIKTLGTGLGLYLTRKILVQLLGGDISVTSKIGEGSIFTIRVPIKLPKIVMQNHSSILDHTT